MKGNEEDQDPAKYQNTLSLVQPRTYDEEEEEMPKPKK